MGKDIENEPVTKMEKDKQCPPHIWV